MSEAIHLQPDGDGVLVPVKVVPGAKREKIAGPHGGALKLSVTQPPENGAANRAVCRLIAQAVGVDASAVSLVKGQTNPWKTVRVAGVDVEQVRQRLAVD